MSTIVITPPSERDTLMLVLVCPECGKWVTREDIKAKSYSEVVVQVKTAYCGQVCGFRDFKMSDACTVRNMTIETFPRRFPFKREIMFGKSPFTVNSNAVGVDNFSILASARARMREQKRGFGRTELAEQARATLISLRDFARTKNGLSQIQDENVPDVCRLEQTLLKRHRELAKDRAKEFSICKIRASCLLWDIGERILAHRIVYCGAELLAELKSKKIGEHGMTKMKLFDILVKSESVEEAAVIEDFVKGCERI